MLKSPTVILADGNFPVHDIPLACLRNADHIVCCDGSAERLVVADLEPYAIVGDLDSLSDEIAVKYSEILYRDIDQETNDLTKAVRWCSEKGFEEVVILGATGKREDHTIGNISLLTEYSSFIRVSMITDTGIILPMNKSGIISSFPGQQVSVFSSDKNLHVTSTGLKYKMDNLQLANWWRATLNEAEGHEFELRFEGGDLLVFLKFRE